MVVCRPRLVILALFWLIAFVISLSIYIISLCALLRTTCTIEKVKYNENKIERCGETEFCRYEVPVTFELRNENEKIRSIAITPCQICLTPEKFEEEFSKKEVDCYYERKNPQNVHLDREDISEEAVLLAPRPFPQILLALTIIFAVFFIVVMVLVFEAELIRICPRFILTAWMNLSSFRLRRSSSSRTSVPPRQVPEDFASPPSAITSRRRVSKLIESAKLSANEAKALREEGWSCCICLEEKDDDEQQRPVARLRCNHATHSECLRMWLETGRAACCLCNADVFSDGTKEPSLSSRASSASGGDAGLIGSLVVERTDRTPSSPGTSVFIDASQAYSDTAPSNDERDGDIESGA